MAAILLACVAGSVGFSQGIETLIDLDAAPASFGPGVSMEGRALRITSPGRFRLTGQLTGTVVVDAAGQHVTLLLDGADIRNGDGPAIRIAAAEAVTLELVPVTRNSLTDGGESEFDAALYSEAPLTIRGDGALEVRAVYEGISSTSHITIEGGELVIVSGEDGLNANQNGVSRITVSGGYLFIETETGDGIDSNGTLEISGGTVIAFVTFGSGEGGLDADDGITITGGTVVATGMRAPIPLRTPGEQKALILAVRPVPRAGELLVVADAQERVVLAVEALQRFGSLLVSTPSVREGERYRVFVGGEPTSASRDGTYRAVEALGDPIATVRPGVISRVGHGHPGILPR